MSGKETKNLELSINSKSELHFGKTFSRKISELRIFIYGLRGLGAEISKNLILSGFSKITLYDNSLVTLNDLSSNFFVTKDDVEKNSRADITQRGLMEINNFALVSIYKGELSNDFSILDDYQLVIITEIINLETAETLNQYCRNKKIGFIYTAEFGLASFLFTDFGDDFIVEDMTGKETKKYFIKNITNACPGIVEIDPIIIKNENGEKIKKFLKLSTGDFVSFKDVSGMTELNDTPPRPIRVLSCTNFTIEDTTKFQEFTGKGIVEEIKVPHPAIFKPLSEAKNMIYYEDVIEEYLNEDVGNLASKICNENDMDYMIGGGNPKKSQIKNEESNNIPWIKMFYSSHQNDSLMNLSSEKLHLGMLTLHEFFGNHQFLPHFMEKNDIDECIDISIKILNKAKEEGNKWAINLQKIDQSFLEKLFKYSRLYFTPVTSFLGGVVAEEILKFIGLYKPASQWVYFQFFDLLNENDDINNNNIIKNNNLDENYKRNIEIYSLFGKDKINEMKNLNILIIGSNDVSHEILRNLIMLDFPTKNGNITLVDNDKSQINDIITDLKNNEKINCNALILHEDIDFSSENNFQEKDWWKKSHIIFNTLPFNFHSKEKLLIMKKCKKNNKILFDINSNLTIGSFEIILPKKLSKNKNDSFFLQEIETPDGNNNNINNDENNINENKNDNNGNSINIISEENEIDEYKDLKCILTLEDSLNWAKDFFEKKFNINIHYLNKLISKSDSENEMTKYLDDLMNKLKDDVIILKLIRSFQRLVTLKLGMNFETIVFYSLELFQELYEFSVEEILQKYPSDLIIKGTNKKFWSGARAEPKIIKFDVNNEDHFQFVYCVTYFLCNLLKMEDIDTKMKTVKEITEKYEPKKFDTAILKKVKLADFSSIEKFNLVKLLGEVSKNSKLQFKDLEINYKSNNEDFEKMNKQLKFVITAAKIKLSSIGICLNNENKAITEILEINDFQPAVSSSISGLSIIQLFNLMNNKEICEFVSSVKDGKIEENNNKINVINENDKNSDKGLKNAVLNMAYNTYLFFDLFNNEKKKENEN